MPIHLGSLLFGAVLVAGLWLPVGASAQDDSCQYAFDSECDEGRYGGGAYCQDGTDTTDCKVIAATADCEFAFDYECDDASVGGTGYCSEGSDAFDCARLITGTADDSCAYANDNECDEPRFDGTGVCRDGTDTADCQGLQDALDQLIDMVPDDVAARLGDDSCEYSNDGECDDAALGGTDFCAPGTDATDCRALAMGGEDSCEYANDGECDEPGIGLGYCASGTDRTDCAPVEFLRNRDNTCIQAFDGICNEPGDGDGACATRSDTADCIGRGRPAMAGDHYFGRDDRHLVDVSIMPWRAFGLLISADHSCTAQLVGPDLILTAAHCITDDGEKIVLPEVYQAGATGGQFAGEARVVEVLAMGPYSPETQPPGEGNGTDWALLRIDRSLGSELGWLNVHVLTEAEIARANREGLLVSQAGYSWDTGDNLSGHEGCRVTEVFGDGSFQHECDTTFGDSGSAIVLNVDGEWRIIGVESQFFDPEDKNNAFATGSLAVHALAFYKDVLKALGQG